MSQVDAVVPYTDPPSERCCDTLLVDRRIYLAAVFAAIAAVVAELVCRVVLDLGDGVTPLIVIPAALGVFWTTGLLLRRRE